MGAQDEYHSIVAHHGGFGMSNVLFSWSTPEDFTLGCFPRFSEKESQKYATLFSLLKGTELSVQDSLYILLTEDSECVKWVTSKKRVETAQAPRRLLQRFPHDKKPLEELDELMLASLRLSTKYSVGELSLAEYTKLSWRNYLRAKVRKSNKRKAEITIS
jgi:hypothetical protein